MDELHSFYNKLVKKSRHSNLEVEEPKLTQHLKINIDCKIPTEDRPNRRSSTLTFIYSKEFLQDNHDILSNTPREQVLKIINEFDFHATTHSKHEILFPVKYVIKSDKSIERIED